MTYEYKYVIEYDKQFMWFDTVNGLYIRYTDDIRIATKFNTRESAQAQLDSLYNLRNRKFKITKVKVFYEVLA